VLVEVGGVDEVAGVDEEGVQVDVRVGEGGRSSVM